MRQFALRHARRIWWYASLLGVAGLGHLLFWQLDHWHDGLGLGIAFLLVFMMAVTKIYLEHIASGIRFWPRRRQRRRISRHA
ncbi:MAG TPA: hypothetical protein VFW23_09110 [Tepidisphaeraceae bacterium]|nr:hypothetical protein [Tepidisphaeraceae bacterium]